MANTFSTTQYVLDEVFVRFINYLYFARTANRNLQDQFRDLTYATGQTVNYRLEERYIGGEGATAVPEDRVQVIRPLTIDKQFHQMVELSTFELTFDRAKDQPYLDQWLTPAAKTLANKVEKFIGDRFKDEIYFSVGSPATATDFDTILDTQQLMDELAIPDDMKRYGAMNPRDVRNLSSDLHTSFNSRVNTGALMHGFIGELADFDIFKTNFLGLHQSGTGGGAAAVAGKIASGTLNGVLVDGASTIALTGLPVSTAGVFLKGDVLEIESAAGAGYFFVNPLTRTRFGKQAQFVVTADTATDAGGLATVPVSPVIALTGARQNIEAASATGSEVVSLYASHNISIMYHNQALVFAAPPIAELRGGVDAATTYSDQYKLSITYTQGADVTNYQQLDRLDLLSGLAINPEFAVRLMSLPA